MMMLWCEEDSVGYIALVVGSQGTSEILELTNAKSFQASLRDVVLLGEC
jgi:hypothetical protein